MDEDTIIAAILTAGTLVALGRQGVQGVPYSDAKKGLENYQAYLDVLQKQRESASEGLMTPPLP